jgi:hypothetical protein
LKRKIDKKLYADLIQKKANGDAVKFLRCEIYRLARIRDVLGVSLIALAVLIIILLIFLIRR